MRKIFILIGVVIIVTLGSFLTISYYSRGHLETISTTQDLVSTTTTAVQSRIVYQNEKVGVEFQYPSELKLISDITGQFDSIISVQLIRNNDSKQEVTFHAVEQQVAGTPEKLIDQQTNYKDPSTGKEYALKEKKKLSDNPLAYELIFGDGQFGHISIVTKNKVWWTLSWYNTSDFQPIAEQIFSTIKLPQ